MPSAAAARLGASVPAANLRVGTDLTYLNDLIHSLKREAEETRARLRMYPSRQPRRTIAEQNLKRREQRLATLQELRLAERN